MVCNREHASLAFGPSLSAREKAKKLGANSRIQETLRRHLAGADLDPVIHDVADPTEIELARGPLEYLRQIRHNTMPSSMWLSAPLGTLATVL